MHAEPPWPLSATLPSVHSMRPKCPSSSMACCEYFRLLSFDLMVGKSNTILILWLKICHGVGVGELAAKPPDVGVDLVEEVAERDGHP